MSWSHTYNITTAMAAFPCAQPNPIIMAVTLVPAIAPALLEYAGFGCRDIMKFRVGIGAPCGRALKGDLQKAIPPKYTNAVGNILKFEHAFSQVGNAFLIADLVSDTVARWTTLAYQLSGCPDALDHAAWQGEWSAAAAILPNTPTAVGGRIVNQSGITGVAWPTGAIVPTKWYYTGEFNVTAVDIINGQSVGIKMWVEKTSPHHYDFPALNYKPGYGIVNLNSHYFLPETQNNDVGPAQYTYMVETDRLCLIDSFTASGQASPFPMAEWALSPLSCITSLGAERIVNPQGRNRTSRKPTVAEALLKPILPEARRGPRGGKPRSKK